MKRSGSIFLGFLLALSLFFGSGMVLYAEGSTTINVSDSSPSVGDKVTISVSGSESSTITVKYSSAVLTFDSCSVAGYSSDGNSVVFSGKSGDITFKAASGGKADVIVSSDSLSGSSVSVNVAGEAVGDDTADDAAAAEAPAADDTSAADASSPASAPSGDGDFNVDGVDYVVSERYSDSEVPAGFDRATLDIHGKTYSEPVNDKLTLLYLKPASDTSGSGVFYIYDQGADSVSRMYLLGSNDSYVIELPGSAADYPMLSEASVTVDEESMPAYQLSGSTNDFYYVYGVDQDMEEGWFTYRESTGQVVFADIYALSVTSDNTSDEPEEDTEVTEEDKDSFLSGISASNKRNIVIFAVIIIAVIIIFIINLYVFRRSDDDDDIWSEPDDDEGDDDEEPDDDSEVVYDTPDMIHPEMDDDSDTDEDKPVIPPIVPIGAAGGAGTGVWYFFWWRRRRKIRGCIIDKDGNPVEGLRVVIAGKQVLEAVTDKNGEYAFKSVKGDVLEYHVYDGQCRAILSLEIATKEKSVEDIFEVISNDGCDVEYDRSGKTLFVDVTVPVLVRETLVSAEDADDAGSDRMTDGDLEE